MPNYLHRTTKQYLVSISPVGLQEPEANYIMDPDISAVQGEPSKYWVITGDLVSLADQTTQDAIDAALLAASILADKDSEKSRFDAERVLRGLVKVLLDELNTLRAIHSLPERTLAQAKTAILNAIDGDV